MAEGDKFTPMGRGWSTAGRQLAEKATAPETVAHTVLAAMCAEIKKMSGLPALFTDLCQVITAYRDALDRTPLFAADPVTAYAFPQEARRVCAEHKRRGASTEVAEQAAIQALVEARQKPNQRPPVRDALADTLLSELFESHFAARVESHLVAEGHTADEAHERVDACRDAVQRSRVRADLARSVSRRPGAKSRRIGLSSPKKPTADILNQPLGTLLAPASASPTGP